MTEQLQDNEAKPSETSQVDQVTDSVPESSGVVTFANLTPREMEVLELVTHGLGNRQIGQELEVSAAAIKFHLGNIYKKLDVHNRTQAAGRFVMNHVPTS